MAVTNNGHARRLDLISRKLTPDPEQPITIEQTLQAIAQLEADPQRSHLLGMPIEVCMSLVDSEILRLEAELGER